MPYRAHDGDRAGVDGPGQGLVVEGPQVLDGSPAPSDDDDVRKLGMAAEEPNAAEQVRGSARSLHEGGIQVDLRQRIALGDGLEHILDGRASRRGHHAHGARKLGQFPFVRGIEQTLVFQFFLQFQIRGVQGAQSVRRHVVDIDLVGPGFGKERDPSVGHDLHPVVRPEVQPVYAVPEHDGADDPVRVLETEIHVSGRVGTLVVGDLPADEYVPEGRVCVEKGLDPGIQFPDPVYGLVIRHDGHLPSGPRPGPVVPPRSRCPRNTRARRNTCF